MNKTASEWRKTAQSVSLDGRLFLNGERHSSISGETYEKRSPIDGRLLGQVARGQSADIDIAVENARLAYVDGRWSMLPPAQRKSILQRFARNILDHSEELALMETLDMGKPIKTSLNADVPGTAAAIFWYAEAIDKVYGEIAPTGPEALALITREPVGVVAAIVPWNYPLYMASWKLGPALAAGNSVVLKPSERSPFSALRLAELALEAGVPPGILNVVPGYGTEAGQALAMHMDVDAIGFTGSTRVGRKILAYSSQSNLKRVFNELGGKSAFIVFDDFNDLSRAAATVAACIFYNQGESCNAPSRLLVHENIAEDFAKLVASHAALYAPGDPLDPQTEMGAVVDEPHLHRILRYIETGITEGAKLIAGGHQAREKSGGFYIEPTVFDNVSNHMLIARKEIFGPVLSIIRFKTEEHAVRIANDSPYGLSASVWSSQIDRAHRVARALHAGTVHINSYDEDDMTVPFGGYKLSGNGRDKSLHALDKYTELKTTWLKLAPRI